MSEILDAIAINQRKHGIKVSEEEAAEIADRVVAEDREEQARKRLNDTD